MSLAYSINNERTINAAEGSLQMKNRPDSNNSRIPYSEVSVLLKHLFLNLNMPLTEKLT
jgi:hypothetical protein